MKIILGSDHGGYNTKEKLKKFLEKNNYSFIDMGTHSEENVDYPDFATKVIDEVKKNKKNRGILICGSGTGMAIAANRVKGIRAVAAYDKYTAMMSRHDNDTNVLTLRGRKFFFFKIKCIVNTWLNSPFSKLSRHKRRIEKLG